MCNCSTVYQGGQYFFCQTLNNTSIRILGRVRGFTHVRLLFTINKLHIHSAINSKCRLPTYVLHIWARERLRARCDKMFRFSANKCKQKRKNSKIPHSSAMASNEDKKGENSLKSCTFRDCKTLQNCNSNDNKTPTASSVEQVRHNGVFQFTFNFEKFCSIESRRKQLP